MTFFNSKLRTSFYTTTVSAKESDGEELSPFLTTSYSAEVSFRYRIPLTGAMQMELGAGFAGKTQDLDESDFVINTISLTGSANVLYPLSDILALRGGVKLSTPVYSTATDGTGNSEDLEETGFGIHPFIGVCYLY